MSGDIGDMPLKHIAPFVAASIILLAPATASADYAHVVMPGETLTSVAAADGLSLSALAAANGLSPGAQLVSGMVLQIPPQNGNSTAAPTTAGSSTGATPGTGDGDTDSDDVGTSTSTGSTPAVSTSYVVQPGDTLTAIAQRDGTTVHALAALNGLSPRGVLVSGTALALPAPGTGSTTTSSTTSAATQYVSSPSGTTSTGGPYPTNQTVSGSEIASIASANGVPASLAQAIGWQESGWNNSQVSPVGAVGVMQIVPGTWQWIQQHMAGGSLSPDSATDNVRGGVLLLHSLLSLTGSDSMAAAGYYQGLASVRAHGLYPSTQQYVRNVLALQSQFGGGG
jgi:LysM repeat protein